MTNRWAVVLISLGGMLADAAPLPLHNLSRSGLQDGNFPTLKELQTHVAETIGGEDVATRPISAMEKDLLGVASSLQYRADKAPDDQTFRETIDLTDREIFKTPIQLGVLADDYVEVEVTEQTPGSAKQTFETKSGALWKPESFQKSPFILSPGKTYSVTVKYHNEHRWNANGKVDLDGVTVYAFLFPVDIAVRKKGTSAAPDDGLIVKKTDILEFALAPQYFDQEKQFENMIAWESRKLKADGQFETDWVPFGAHGKGTKFEQTTDYAGIYQIRAVIAESEDKPQYLRKKDAIHATGSDGKYNEELRKGKPDFIGVVDEDWQIILRNTAKGFLGNTTYALNIHKEVYSGGPDTEDSNKCNIFVYHCGNSSGTHIPLDWSYFSASKPGWITMPPLANHWADGSRAINKWTFLGGAMPQPGFVVIKKGIAGFSGHMGILNYDGTWINAGEKTVNQSIHLSTHPKYQPALFRKYTP